MRTRLALFALVLGVAPHSRAAEGVLEINQTCAVQTGCFAGDTAAFPVLITAPGSYRLTSNLILPNENTDGIVVQASDVGIDLNNFAIVRSGCEATTSNCTPASGTGAGVRRTSASRRAISVRNGSITGMGEYGVVLGQQAEVTNLRVRWNRVAGIYADIGSMIADSLAYQNAGNGIEVGNSATVSGCRADGNGGTGIEAGDSATISNSSAYQNGRGIRAGDAARVSGFTATFNLVQSGIDVGSGSAVNDSTASFNASGSGIAVGAFSTVSNSTASHNAAGITTRQGSTVSNSTAGNNSGDGIYVESGSTVGNSTTVSNGGDGIQAEFRCLVHGSNAVSNGQAGFRLDHSSAYRENSITFNSGAAVLGSPIVNLGANHCTNSANTAVACP